MSKIQVHHAVEQNAATRYSGVVDEFEINSPENLRGIPKDLVDPITGKLIHQSNINTAWNTFFKIHRTLGQTPTKAELLEFATYLDDIYGSTFAPPVR